MNRSLVVVVVVVVVVWAPSHGLRAQQPMPGVPACYDVTLGDWPGSLSISADSLVYSVPPRILLDPTPVRPSNSDVLEAGVLRRLTVPTGGLPTPHRLTGWARLSADSARIIWSTGFVGVRARVAWTEDGFVGAANTFTDVVVEGDSSNTTVDISGLTVDCDAPLVYRLSDQRRLTQSVPLAAGGSIALGAPPESTVGWTPYRPSLPNVCEVSDAFLEPFADPVVTHVSVSTLSGTIRRIRLWYALPSDYERLKEHLTSLNGPPVRQTPGPLETVVESLHWQNRTTRVHLYLSTARADRRVSLILEDLRTFQKPPEIRQ